MTDQHDNSGPAVASTDDLKARPLDEVFDTMMEVEKDPYGAWEAIQTQADRIEQLEAALTQSQDLVDRWINTSSEQYQTIVEMREALTQSQTEVAAAYERAADVVDDCRRSPAFVGLGCDPIIEAIRALATPDQTAALDRMIAEAVGSYVKALAWYGEQARLARLIHIEGDAGRNALQADGGKRANAILAASMKGEV